MPCPRPTTAQSFVGGGLVLTVTALAVFGVSGGFDSAAADDDGENDAESVSRGYLTGSSAPPPPTYYPFIAPSKKKKSRPSIAPSDRSSLRPSIAPSDRSSRRPSSAPSITPSESSSPSLKPSISGSPSNHPSSDPTATGKPSLAPSSPPTATSNPTSIPSSFPSTIPSSVPSKQPSSSPSESSKPTSVVTHSPSESLSPTQKPTNNPTKLLSSISSTGTFNLRLHWQQGFFWQESYEETWFCMSCGICNENAFQENCVIKDVCEENMMIAMYNCDPSYTWWNPVYTTIFTLVRESPNPFNLDKNHFEGDQIQVYNTNLCLQMVNGRSIYLLQCDASNKEQRFLGFQAGGQAMELSPLADTERCLTQDHHPRQGERVFAQECRVARYHETNLWSTY